MTSRKPMYCAYYLLNPSSFFGLFLLVHVICIFSFTMEKQLFTFVIMCLVLSIGITAVIQRAFNIIKINRRVLFLVPFFLISFYGSLLSGNLTAASMILGGVSVAHLYCVADEALTVFYPLRAGLQLTIEKTLAEVVSVTHEPFAFCLIQNERFGMSTLDNMLEIDNYRFRGITSSLLFSCKGLIVDDTTVDFGLARSFEREIGKPLKKMSKEERILMTMYGLV